jgi:hypothetical protein
MVRSNTVKYFIYPYIMASRSAKALRDALDGKLVLRSGSSYKYQSDHLLINWGCGECPHPQALNYKIMDLINKTRFFKRLEGSGLTPAFATSMEGAKALGYPVFCRTTVEGHDGKGIVIADCVGQLTVSPLYVKAVEKTAEYRVHAGRLPDGTVRIIGVSEKFKKAVTPEMTNVPTDPRIWCGDTTVFGDFMVTDSVIPKAVSDVVASAFAFFPEVTFAAFDVVFNSADNKAYVIEANSAPMSTPQTTKAYAQFFTDYAELANLPKPAQVLVPPATPVAGSTLTVDDVLNSIFLGEISPTKVIEGYIQYVQK